MASDATHFEETMYATVSENLFQDAELIFAYTRADAIRDGVLVDLSADSRFAPLIREAGFRLPIAMTAEAHRRYVALTPAAQRALNDETGRLWDVLWMLRRAIAGARNASVVEFTFYCVVERVRPSRCRLKAVIGPGDDDEPVLTIMLPEED